MVATVTEETTTRTTQVIRINGEITPATAPSVGLRLGPTAVIAAGKASPTTTIGVEEIPEWLLG